MPQIDLAGYGVASQIRSYVVGAALKADPVSKRSQEQRTEVVKVLLGVVANDPLLASQNRRYLHDAS
jgi:hypothetical protein